MKTEHSGCIELQNIDNLIIVQPSDEVSLMNDISKETQSIVIEVREKAQLVTEKTATVVNVAEDIERKKAEFDSEFTQFKDGSREILNQTLAAKNTAVNAATSAESLASSAAKSAFSAGSYARSAETSENNAARSERNAETSATAAANIAKSVDTKALEVQRIQNEVIADKTLVNDAKNEVLAAQKQVAADTKTTVQAKNRVVEAESNVAGWKISIDNSVKEVKADADKAEAAKNGAQQAESDAKSYLDKFNDLGDKITIEVTDEDEEIIIVEKKDLDDLHLALNEDIAKLRTDKQDALVSGTNIKTVNGNSLLGSGNLVISGGTSGDWDEPRIEAIENNFERVTISDNKYDESKDSVGVYLQNNVLHTMNKWTTTDFIYVHGLRDVYLSAESADGTRKLLPFMFLNKYNSNKGFIECIDLPGSSQYTIEENVYYIRFCFENDKYRNMCLRTAKTKDYDAYKSVLRLNGSDYATGEGLAKTYEIADNIEYISGKNLFDESKITKYAYINTNGLLTPHSDWNVTDFMPVYGVSNIYATRYSSAQKRIDCYLAFFTAYDENKNFITQFRNQATTGSYPVSIPNGTHFLRVCYKNNDGLEGLQIEAGEYPTSYEPYTIEMKFIKSPYNRKATETKWKGKKWVCVGDSLTEANIRTTMHYHDYVAEDTGITVINLGSSGTGYKKTEEQNKAFYQRILNVPTDADVVTIFGSFNDYSLVASSLGNPTDTGTDTICGCINTTIDRLIQLIPRVQLGIVSPTPWGVISETNGYGQYVNALATICKNRGIPYLDLYHCSGLRPWTTEGKETFYSKDDGNGVHPDENGHKLIAPRFKAFLETLLM